MAVLPQAKGHAPALAYLRRLSTWGTALLQGIPPNFYLEHLDREVLGSMGFSPDDAKGRPYLFVRVPVFKQSIFRAAVARDGVPVADIIQVWLDVSSPPVSNEASQMRSVGMPLFRFSRRGREGCRSGTEITVASL